MSKINHLFEIDKNITNYYIEKINEGISNKNIKNIALMGPYGSGKSTILSEFKKSKEDNCINVSMMEFNSKNGEENVKNNNPNNNNNKRYQEIDVEKIEKSIIRQLIHKTSQNKIPYTKLKSEKPSNKKITINIILFIFLIGLIALYFASDWYKTNNVWKIAGAIIMSIFISYFLFIFIKNLYINYKVSRITFGKGLTDIKCEKNENTYNYFIDELIYYFKSTKYTTVIFEDIDRFDFVLFFSHLRELNNLLNNRLKNKIVFIYAVKEDIFLGQDKHKFFDLIIPVIPIIDYSNSFNKMKELFKNEPSININTLRILSYFLYDLRV
ncbi:MAG: hypothetical protein K2L64_01660, partial [Ureaplasma sp.]|nr:hypothetical protein [Ureaplasma sp.]